MSEHLPVSRCSPLTATQVALRSVGRMLQSQVSASPCLLLVVVLPRSHSCRRYTCRSATRRGAEQRSKVGEREAEESNGGEGRRATSSETNQPVQQVPQGTYLQYVRRRTRCAGSNVAARPEPLHCSSVAWLRLLVTHLPFSCLCPCLVPPFPGSRRESAVHFYNT